MLQPIVDGHLCLVAAHRFPDHGPVGGCVDLRGYSPIRPGSSLPWDTVNHRSQLAESGLVSLPLVISPRQVVELGNAVSNLRSGTVSGIAGAHDGGGRELRDSDVVGVAVCAFRAERDDHVGPNAPDVPDNFSYRDRSIYLVDGSVRIAQDGDFTDPEHRVGRSVR